MPTYDIHAHINVPEFTRAAAPREAWRPNVVWEDGRQYVEHGSKRGSAARRAFVRIERILEEAAQAETDVLVVCPWSPLMRPKAPAGEALAACRIQNDALAALAESYPTGCGRWAFCRCKSCPPRWPSWSARSPAG